MDFNKHLNKNTIKKEDNPQYLTPQESWIFMLTQKQAYNPSEEYLALVQKRKLKIVKRMREKINKLGLNFEDLGLST